MTFASECKRKDELLYLFESLEKAHLRPRKDYERVIKTCAAIVKIGKASLTLARESGEKLSPVLVTPEIAKRLTKEDVLSLTLGLYKGQWYIIFLQYIQSVLTEENHAEHSVRTE